VVQLIGGANNIGRVVTVNICRETATSRESLQSRQKCFCAQICDHLNIHGLDGETNEHGEIALWWRLSAYSKICVYRSAEINTAFAELAYWLPILPWVIAPLLGAVVRVDIECSGYRLEQYGALNPLHWWSRTSDEAAPPRWRYLTAIDELLEGSSGCYSLSGRSEKSSRPPTFMSSNPVAVSTKETLKDL